MRAVPPERLKQILRDAIDGVLGRPVSTRDK
jgi:hypothetical protein